MSKTTAMFRITGWDEKPIAAAPGKPKLTTAHVTCTFAGDVVGDGVADYLMAYPTSDTATFVGLQQIDGQVGDYKGSLVLEVTGKFEAGVASATWSVVTGTGTGELAHISGTGGYVSKSDGSAEASLDFSL